MSAPQGISRNVGDLFDAGSAGDELKAAADLLRSATLDSHTAADLILDTEAHACVLGKSFCYVCEVQAEQQEGRRL